MVKENGRPTSSTAASGTNDPRLFAGGTDEEVYPLRRGAHSYRHSVCAHSVHRTERLGWTHLTGSKCHHRQA